MDRASTGGASRARAPRIWTGEVAGGAGRTDAPGTTLLESWICRGCRPGRGARLSDCWSSSGQYAIRPSSRAACRSASPTPRAACVGRARAAAPRRSSSTVAHRPGLSHDGVKPTACPWNRKLQVEPLSVVTRTRTGVPRRTYGQYIESQVLMYLPERLSSVHFMTLVCVTVDWSARPIVMETASPSPSPPEPSPAVRR